MKRMWKIASPLVSPPINWIMSLCCVPSAVVLEEAVVWYTGQRGHPRLTAGLDFKLQNEILTLQLHPISVQPPHRSRVGVKDFKA